jgi:hypothetical protein
MHQAVLPVALQRHKHAVRLNALDLATVAAANLRGLVRLAPTAATCSAKQPPSAAAAAARATVYMLKLEAIADIIVYQLHLFQPPAQPCALLQDSPAFK